MALQPIASILALAKLDQKHENTTGPPPGPISPQDNANTEERPEGQAPSSHQEGGQWYRSRILH